MKSNTRKLTLSALFATTSLVLLTFAQVLPSGRYALMIIAGIPILVISLVLDSRFGILSYGAVAILINLFFPLSVAAICFTVAFGIYPSIQVWIEKKLFPKRIRMLIKIFYAQIAISILTIGAYLILKTPNWIFSWYGIVIVYVVGNFGFWIYDKGLIITGSFFLRRFSHLLKKWII